MRVIEEYGIGVRRSRLGVAAARVVGSFLLREYRIEEVVWADVALGRIALTDETSN